MRSLRILLTVALVATGCVSTNPRPSFEAVSTTVRQRTQLQAAWSRSAEERAAALAEVRALLAAPLTAESAAQVALFNNPGLQAELAVLGIAQADLAQASRLSNPSIDGFWRRPTGDGTGTNREGGLLFNLLDDLLVPARKRIATAELERTKLEVGSALLDTVAATREAFYRYLGSEQLLNRLGKILEIDRVAAEFARALYEAGNLGELELRNAEAMLAQTTVDLGQTRLAVQKGREALNRWMGLWGADTSWTAGDRLPELPAELPELTGLERRAVAERLDIAAGRWAVNAVGKALALKKGTRFFPAGIEIGVSTERDLDGTRVTGPALALELPIFDTGKASIARLEAEYERTQRQLEELAIRVRSEVREARAELAASTEIAAYTRDVLLPQRVRILELTLLHYDAMLKGAFDVLLAKQSEIAVERAYIGAWRDAWIARVHLDRAVGSFITGGGVPNPSMTDLPDEAKEAHRDHS